MWFFCKRLIIVFFHLSVHSSILVLHKEYCALYVVGSIHEDRSMSWVCAVDWLCDGFTKFCCDINWSRSLSVPFIILTGPLVSCSTVQHINTRVCMIWLRVWRNHSDTVILLKFLSEFLEKKIIVAHCDSVKLTTLPIQTRTATNKA
jgi:hypothetical protein